MPLQALPTEIQSQIFSHLIVSYGPSPIHSVLRTCRQLYQVALPLSVQIFRNTAPLSASGGPCSKARNTQFLHYILVSKPELAKYIETLIFGIFSSSDCEDEHEASIPVDVSIYEQRIKSMLGAATFRDYKPECSRWIADLRRGSTDAQVALILLTCPNVKSLCFEEPEGAQNVLFLLRLSRTLSSSARPTKIPVSNLREVYGEATHKNFGYKMGSQEVSALLALPSLRSYEIALAGSRREPEKALASLPSRFSSIEELTLYRSYVSGSVINSLISACKHLRSFVFTRGLYGLPEPYMQARDIMEAILPHAATLENLHLNLDDDWYQKGPPQRLYMGTELRRMVALKKLRIGMRALTGMLDAHPHGTHGAEVLYEIDGAPRLTECLPENLEHLVIHGCGRNILDQAHELLRVIQNEGRFSHLECIHFLFNHENIDPSEVQLRPGIPKPRLLVVFQDDRSRVFDSGPPHPMEDEGRSARTIVSRIYSADYRELWLGRRGGFSMALWQPPASKDGAIYDNPFVGRFEEFFMAS
ncbi:unnamed protein product [Clonostachys rosea]|uniref:F-box domain-containing protein n=1 Tax=Bionectria ochroleuca TaxID=29856 RepID=A0ABY6UXK5_BIOOC|nr:unnamed protein product [Clonostachys rosea]